MRSARAGLLLCGLASIGPLLLAACGGGETTATPVPPSATSAPATATPTRPAPTTAPVATAAATVAPTATAAPTPAPTATPVPTPTQRPPTPTPVTLPGKRGGVLQLPGLAGQPLGYDTFESGAVGQAGHEVWQPMMNNLIQPDPYGDGYTLEGDAASRWEISQNGTVITFFLRQGIKFHDGMPLTAKDVAYNIDRAWKPRSTNMTNFQAKFTAIRAIDTPDDYTVRVTLSASSNALLRSMSMNQFTIYPAHLPFPEKSADFKKQPIGSGPFKLKSVDQGIRIEYVRNNDYWKPGLPYLDGIVYTPLTGEAVIAAFRTGRVDAPLFNSNELRPTIVKTLQREQRFTPLEVAQGLAHLVVNQREPWTNPKVREALSLALDRQALVDTWQDGAGNPYAPPMLPPEQGGRWGISVAVMKTRPGFGTNKDADVARAKQILKEANVDPTKYTVSVRSTNTQALYGQVVESAVRTLGFKTNLTQLGSVENTDLLRRGDFDVYPAVSSISFDDPLDYLVQWVVTGGGFNWGKWSNPTVDKLLDEQDKTLDEGKRKEQLLQLQEIILSDFSGPMIPTLHRVSFYGYMPWVKNYYPRLPFAHSPRLRWEQVWLER